MIRLTNAKGQLLLPMLGLFFVFGLAWIGYVEWCRTIYWKMRTDITAKAVALSTARQQAELLNAIATGQSLENLFFQRVKVISADVAHMQRGSQRGFETLNQLINLESARFVPQTLAIARKVARENGILHPPIPLSPLGSHLQAQRVRVFYFSGIWPAGSRVYRQAFYYRAWWPRKSRPQPDHRLGWKVCHGSTCATAWSRLWLDVDPAAPLLNGGFPSEQAPWWGAIGVQCFYPQFNARLMTKANHG